MVNLFQTFLQMLKKELKNLNLVQILVIVLLLILLLQRCGKDPVIVEQPKIIRDTTWIIKDSTINSKPQIIKTEAYGIPIDRWNTEYLPDTNYDKLIKQYEALVRELLAKNISVDSIKIDSIGHIYITDTVSKNIIIGRSTSYDLHYPVITNTITLPAPKKTQWYFGVALQGSKQDLINQINTGILIKNKKDRIYGGYIGITPNGPFEFGIQSYWKIKLKK